MEIIIHRLNSIKELQKLDPIFGAEIDIRAYNSNLILNHEPYQDGDKLIDYLNEYKNKTLILNIKEAGIEDDVLKLVKSQSEIKSYFLLDVEFPYIFSASKKGEKNIAIRFSEHENIKLAKEYIGKLNWVWIDTITQLPIKKSNIDILNNFKKCLVCPERWGRPKDIKLYKNFLKKINFNINAVMTSNIYAKNWISEN